MCALRTGPKAACAPKSICPPDAVTRDRAADGIRDDNLRLVLSKDHAAWLARRRADLVKAQREAVIGMVLGLAWLAATPLWIALSTRLSAAAAVPEWAAVAVGVALGLVTLLAPFVVLIAAVDWVLNRRRLIRADAEAADHAAFLERYNRAS
jgi:hypothetical protein